MPTCELVECAEARRWTAGASEAWHGWPGAGARVCQGPSAAVFVLTGETTANCRPRC